jgi:DNA-binding transcriptional LysR family regulator
MHLMAIGPRSLKPIGSRSIDIVDLVQRPLLALTRAFASRHWLENACRSVAIEPRVAFESSSPHTLVSLALAGHGTAVVPSPVTLPADTTPCLPVVSKGKAIGAWATIARYPSRYQPPYVEDFISGLLDHVAEDYPNKRILDGSPPLQRPKRQPPSTSG